MAKKRSTTTKSTKSRARANTAATGAKGRTKAVRKAKSKPAATRANTRSQKRGGETKPKRVGLLDAAVQILAKAKAPMGCKAIVEQVIRQKLWSTRGRTPHARPTLFIKTRARARRERGRPIDVKHESGAG